MNEAEKNAHKAEKIANAFIEKNNREIEGYRERISNMASKFVNESEYLETTPFVTICMAMSIAYTVALIDAGLLTTEQVIEYRSYESKTAKDKSEIN